MKRSASKSKHQIRVLPRFRDDEAKVRMTVHSRARLRFANVGDGLSAAVIASAEARVHPIRVSVRLLMLVRPQHQDQRRRERAVRVHLAVRHRSERASCNIRTLWWGFGGAELSRTESGAFVSRSNGGNRPSRCAITSTVKTERERERDVTVSETHSFV